MKRISKKQKSLIAELHISLPTRWSELTPLQVSRLSYYSALGISEVEYLVRFGLELAGLKPHGTTVLATGEIVYVYYHRELGYINITPEHVTAIVCALLWLKEPPIEVPAPILDGYKTPETMMYDVSLERFIVADNACSAYISLKNDGALRVMVAALYLRKEFRGEELAIETEKLKRLPLWQLQAVLIWFVSAKTMLSAKYPYVFNSSGNGANTRASGDEILLGLQESLNGGDITKNGAIRDICIHEALYSLNEKIKHSKDV